MTGRLLLWSLALNAVWEWAQCAFLYDMNGSALWNGSVWMLAATVADVFLVLAVVRSAAWLAGKSSFATAEAKGWAALLGIGLTAGILVEWAARGLMLWNYGALMPALHLGGVTVGLAPIAQMTLLPALSVWLATRRKTVQAD
jgi:hypothetical protein